MFKSFRKNSSTKVSSDAKDFSYLEKNTYYFDSACQTLRPQQVIDAELDYYHNYNACGGRVKYKWGQKVDGHVKNARKELLDFLNKKEKDYAVAFTLNTTCGINLILHQIPPQNYKNIIISEIEHNSVFLPSISYAKKHGLQRLILPRSEDGALQFSDDQLEQSIVLVNTTSNIDGRELTNLAELTKTTHEKGGIIMLDAAQTVGHNPSLLQDIDYDCLFGSAHKMYGPSLGFIVIKKDLLRNLNIYMIGGGTVTDVREGDYDLNDNDHELHARLELGLQNWAGIIAFEKTLQWLKNFKPQGMKPHDYENKLAEKLYSSLTEIPGLKLLNQEPSTTISCSSEKIDAHRLALYLSEQGVMSRSGYFCCHYYLKHLKKSPPLYRISLGLNNTEEQINYLADTLKKVLTNV